MLYPAAVAVEVIIVYRIGIRTYVSTYPWEHMLVGVHTYKSFFSLWHKDLAEPGQQDMHIDDFILEIEQSSLNIDQCSRIVDQFG